MNYQAIRAAVENPLLSAFSALVPAVPVYFDNITAVPPNTTTEYVRVNVTFGITNEPTLTSSVDNARGAVVIRIFTEKGRGPARNQTLLTTAVNVLETLNDSTKGTTGVYFKLVTSTARHFQLLKNHLISWDELKRPTWQLFCPRKCL
jgi:hypothetical protein